MFSERNKKHPIPHREGRLRARFGFGNFNLLEYASIVLVFLTLWIAVRSIEQANWITPQPPLTLVLILAIVTGLVLAKSRISSAATILLMMILGSVVTVWQSANLFLLAGTASPADNLISAIQHWWLAVGNSKPSEATLYFAAFIIVVVWITGFISTWFVLRQENAWVAISLGTLIILANLNNLTEEYYYFFPLYSLAAIFLIGQVNLVRQRALFRKDGTEYPRRSMIFTLVAIICFAVLTVSIAWLAPDTQLDRLSSRTMIKMPKLENFNEHWLNLFYAVPPKFNSIESDRQEILLFGHLSEPSDTVLYVITSEKPSYWRTRSYDIYFSQGWRNSPATNHQLDQDITTYNDGNYLTERPRLTYSVENRVKTDVVLVAEEFVSSDIPVVIQSIDMGGAKENRAPAGGPLPLNVASTVPLVNQGTGLEGGSAQEEIEDIITIIVPQILRPYQHYTVTAAINSATRRELSQASEDYEPWLTYYYLQLPSTLSASVVHLSTVLTANAETPYDKVVAMKRFLLGFTYKRTPEVLPLGVDGVTHFIRYRREGNCTNFASVMVVMLRSVGIPSRLCTGFLPGELSEGKFIIRARDYHAWPEVYFPGYGWVAFEATPISPDELPISGIGGLESERESLVSDFGIDEDDEAESGGYAPARGSDDGPSGLASSVRLITGISLLVILVLGSLLYLRYRHFRNAGGPVDIYAKMTSFASFIKLGPSPHETPLEYCTRLATVLPVPAEAIDNIAQAYVQNQFSQRKRLEMPPDETLSESWHSVYHSLLKHGLHFTRWL